jgi:hypothetical protein
MRERTCLAKEGIEAVVQAAEIDGVSELGTGSTISKDLDAEPKQQRERHAEARRPPQDVPPKGLVRDEHQKVADEVHRGPPALRRCEQRERGGPQRDLREMHDEEHAETARF